MYTGTTITITLELNATELETLDRSIREMQQSTLAADLIAAGVRWGREEELAMMLRGRLWELRRLHTVNDNMNSLRAQQIGAQQ